MLSSSRSILLCRAARIRSLSTWAATSAPAASGMTFTPADVQLKPSQVREAFRSMAMQDDEEHSQLAYGLSFANGDQINDDEAWKFSVLTDARMQAQLKHCQEQQQLQQQQKQSPPKKTKVELDTAPLPRTIQDATRPSKRAIVVTETTAPFRVVDVNAAWSDLCGYSFVESQGKSLGTLLKGPKTDQLAATALIAKLLQGETEVGTMLTNYDKNGREFRNRIRVGPLYDEEHPGRVSHFVGILQEV